MTPQFLSQCPICMATVRESQSQAGSMKTWMWELLVPFPSTGSEKGALGFCLFCFDTKAQVALAGLGLNRYVAENDLHLSPAPQHWDGRCGPRCLVHEVLGDAFLQSSHIPSSIPCFSFVLFL